MPSALALIGDRFHKPEDIEESLRPAFRAAGLTVEFCTTPDCLSPQRLSGVDLFLMYKMGQEWPQGHQQLPVVWMTRGQEVALESFVTRGGGFLGLHTAEAGYPTDGLYRRLIGGHFLRHPPLKPFTVRVVDSTHPVVRGVSDFEVRDEQHFVEYDQGAVHVLAVSESEDGRQPAVWVRGYGRGRVCYIANGHTQEVLSLPAMQALLRNALRWCAGLAP